MENRICKCEDYKENIPKINGIIYMSQLHGGQGYTGKQINYCPWCGKKLKVNNCK